MKETRGYNGKRQVESIGLANAGTGVWNLTNYYCATGLNILDCGANNGNVMRQVIQQPKPPSVGGAVTFTVDYGYDGANRLMSVGEALLTDGTQQAYGQTFGYDQYGNRWMKTMTPAMPGGTPNGPSWINGKNQVAGVGTVYDDAGNLQVLGSGSHEFKWDGEGRKVEDAITSGATTYLTWYAYDAEGRRVRKQGSNGAWTVYVYDGRGRVRAEYGSVAGTETSTKYLYGDHLGSTRVVADGSGAVKGRYDYLPSGEEVEAGWNGRSGLEYGSGGGVAQRYTGKERDEGAMEARMDYFGARYLNAGWGRFVSADPLGASAKASNPQTWNRYSHTLNNPLRFVDPDGLEVPSECVKQSSCEIVVRLTVIYDKRLSDRERAAFQKSLAQARRDYQRSNITFQVQEEKEGSLEQTTATSATGNGLVADTLNIFVSDRTPADGSPAGAATVSKRGEPVIFIDVTEAKTFNAYPLGTATLSHEMAHHFIHPVGTRKPKDVSNYSREFEADSAVVFNGNVCAKLGCSADKVVRPGLAPKRYAAPVAPEAQRPQR